jgi:hypothetical protein
MNKQHLCFYLIATLVLHAKSLSSKPEINRRDSLRRFGSTLIGIPFVVPSTANADEGIAAITDSTIGRAFRKSVIKGAQVANELDGQWERLSDGLRNKNRCDPNTGRRLYDNGVRKDGTPIGNPGLGALCEPESLLPLDNTVGNKLLEVAVASALVTSGSKDTTSLNKYIEQTKNLVRPSFERSLQISTSEDDVKRRKFNFEIYATLRAINTYLKDNNASVEEFQVNWGREIVSLYAPSASRKDYTSPFPVKDDEFQDYDYDKDQLLDALGALKVALDRLKEAGLLASYEISIPYDDYGSVVTVAVDDYVPIGAEILLSEQKFLVAGIGQALVRSVVNRARISFSLDTFYIDPSTTRQDNYNPTQLLLSLSSLSKK